MPPRKSTSTGVSRGRPAAKTTKPSQTKLAFHGPVSKKADHAESKKLASKIEAIETPVAPITSIDLPTDNLDSSEQTDLDIFPPGLSTLQFDDDEMIAWKEAVHSARKISPARIKSYWTRKEKDRTVARVHQEGMSLHEKLLADWDIDSRFGPCTGIDRTQRWQRASVRFELDPPLEVLAVLLKENAANPGKAEKSRIASLMSAAGVA